MRENTNLPQGDNNSEQEPQMYVCPKAKECTYKKHVCNIPEDEGRYFPPTYWHCDIHPYNQSCDHHKAHGKVSCPACIPVEPQKQCWNCDSPEGKILPICHKCFDILTVKPQPRQCVGCPEPKDNYNCLSKTDCPQPAPQPLELRKEIFQICAAVCDGSKVECPDSDAENPCPDCRANRVLSVIAAHDSAVASQAVKAFADECIKTLPTPYAPQYRDKVIAHIKAMAGGQK